MLGSSLGQRFKEPMARTFATEKGLSVETRECQRMCMAGVIEAFAGFVFLGFSEIGGHDSHLNISMIRSAPKLS